MYKSTLTQTTLVLVATLLFLTGCDTLGNNEPQAPEVIPEAAFAVDFGLFESAPPASKGGQGYANFLNAFLRVGIVSHLLEQVLAFPVQLTEEAGKVDPVYRDGAFVWEAFHINEQGQKEGFRLEARESATSNAIEWVMYVDGVDDSTGFVYDNFKFYEARTGTEVERGTATLFYPHNGVVQAVMEVSYDVEDESNALLRFAIPESVEEIGGFKATYRYGAPTIYFEFIEGDETIFHRAEWNEETGIGYVQAHDFNGGEKGCWGADLMDIPCPTES